MSEDKISMLAALAGQNTAAKWLTLDSESNAKVVFEVPPGELANVMRLASKTKSLLRLTIEDAD